ncbi:MAG: helix-turn-helix domain-containing protein [Desulfovibrionaceae bacterium]
MENILEAVGAKIRILRKGSGLSQQALAERAGVSYKYLGEIERGQVSLSVEILLKIAQALNVQSTDILEESAVDSVRSRAVFIMAELPESEQKLAVELLEALLRKCRGE